MSSKKANPRICEHCKKTFARVSNKNKHLRNVHGDNSHNSNRQSHIICPACPEDTVCGFSSYELLNDHLTSRHDIQFEVKNLKFESKDHFSEWKEQTEKDTKSSYYLNCSVESTTGKVFYYECHRSNLRNFKSKCQVHAPNISDSIKINGVCPSRIRAQVDFDTSMVSVVYVSTHFGHNVELRCQPLSKAETTKIVEQMRSGVCYETILELFWLSRKIEDGNSNRLNLLTMKDLYSLAKTNNLTGRMCMKQKEQMIDSECTSEDSCELTIDEPAATGENLHEEVNLRMFADASVQTDACSM